jgi:hypothetical protein
MAGGRSQRHVAEIRPRDVRADGSKGLIPNARPTVAGTTTSGQTLTGTPGTFTGGMAVNDTHSITHYWKRAGVEVPGRNATTYLLGAGDVGSKLVYGNRAKSRNGAITVNESLPTATIA